MRRPVLASIDSLDPATREAAESVARKAGVRLEDWVGELLAGRPTLREHRSPASKLDVIVSRMSKRSRAALETQTHARTTSAIESVAGWIERAEKRLSESERHSADYQDRTAAALAEALAALKDRLARVERRVEPDPVAALAGGRAVEAIRAQIDDLKEALGALATRDEIHALDGNLQRLARDLEKRPSGNTVLTLADAISTLHGQVVDLSNDLSQGIHLRIGTDIERLADKIDRLKETGIDRSVIDFLSSQIIDMRHDLAGRPEPRQIERLSVEVASLTVQIAELRANHVGRGDFVSLKKALQDVCRTLADHVARQESHKVPERIKDLGDQIHALSQRPEPDAARLEPIAQQLTELTERISAATDRSLVDSESVQIRFDRLSSQISGALQATFASAAPMAERFDRLEAGLRQVGDLADTSSVEIMVRSLHEKLQRSEPSVSLEHIEAQLAVLMDRIAVAPHHETADLVQVMQREAAAIAENAARTALGNLRASGEWSSGDVAALKSGFAELKAMQTRADSNAQQTLRAVHEALEKLVDRPSIQPGSAPVEPADRLEAAVRRLHAAALSQVEEVSSPSLPQLDAASPRSGATVSSENHDLGDVRASFIAAARRASQGPVVELPGETEGITDETVADSLGHPASARSLIARIRKSFEDHRRPLLFSLAAVALSAGVAGLLSRDFGRGSAPSATLAILMPEDDAVRPVALPESLIQTTSFSPLTDPVADALQKAVDAGNMAALYTLANRRLSDGKANDAARLFEKAAQSGHAPAQQRAASLYEQGIGVEKDLQTAAFWYERAALSGNLLAMQNLATLLAGGIGGQPDYEAAFRWYSEAAEGGLRDSQYNLGILLTKGIGTPRSLPRAYQWFDIAAQQGDLDAAEKRDAIAKRLDPPALAAARSLSERWRIRPIDSDANEVRWPGAAQSAGLGSNVGGKS